MFYQRDPLSAALESVFWKIVVIGVAGSAVWIMLLKPEFDEAEEAMKTCISISQTLSGEAENAREECEAMRRSMGFSSFNDYQNIK